MDKKRIAALLGAVLVSLIIGLDHFWKLVVDAALIGGAWWFTRPGSGSGAETAEESVEVGQGPIGIVYEKAEWGVPHTTFARSSEGFKVTFSQSPVWYVKATGRLADNANASAGAAFGGLIFMAVAGLYVLIYKALRPTQIEVTRDTIIINGKHFSRADFGSFTMDHTWRSSDETHGVLGYTYGHRSFTFGGAWKEREVTEVAKALNSHLRQTPHVGDEHSPAPEQLRAARPTDF